ncbi:MAG: hypothetical protein EOP67_22600 [Sphingomonas sp.]|nr:MAG: hypothetical protein EOP67_22600 [Sphingomonas sp.]
MALTTALGTQSVMAPRADAQAFTQAKGHGRVITSLLWSNSDKGFNDDGHVIDIADYRKTEVYALGEYGVTDDFTVLLTPSFRDVSVKNGSNSSGLGYTDVGARYAVARGSNFVLSAQGLVRFAGQKRRDVQAQVGATDTEYDLRGQAGYTFGQGSFAIVEGGYRLRAGAPPNAFNIDATLGIRAAPRLLLLASSYNAISDGRGRGVFAPYRYHNVYLSGAYDVSDHVTVQLGVSGTVAGRNALRERGLLGGLWYRF